VLERAIVKGHSVCPFVCPSVYPSPSWFSPSHSWSTPKRFNFRISKYVSHDTI